MSSRLVHIYIQNLPKFIDFSDIYDIIPSDSIVASGSPELVKFKLRGVQRHQLSMSFSTWGSLHAIKRRLNDFRRSGVSLNLVERRFDEVYFVEGKSSKSPAGSLETSRSDVTLRNDILGNCSVPRAAIDHMGVNDTQFGRAVRVRVDQVSQKGKTRQNVNIEDAIDLFSGELQASKWDKKGYVVYSKELSAVCFIAPDVGQEFMLSEKAVGKEIAFSAIRQKNKRGKFRFDVDFVHVRPIDQ